MRCTPPCNRIFLTLLALLTCAVGVAAQQRGPTRFADQSDHLAGDFARQTLPFGGNGLGGLAWLDYDRDGDLDLYVTNGPTGNALYRNDGTGRFLEVASLAKAAAPGGAHNAVVAGDLDNDGFPDLIVLGEVLGPFSEACTVLHNQGDGTFEDVSEGAGIDAFPTSLSAALLDYDRDGLLDLFVTAPGTVGRAESAGRVDAEGNPLFWEARVDSSRLYRNLGGLRFEDVTHQAGIFRKVSSCAVAATDFDQDGWQDVVVANCNEVTEGPVFGSCPPGIPCRVCDSAEDPGPCRPEDAGGGLIASPFNFWRNNGDGTFTDVAQDPSSGLTDVLGYWMSVTPGDFDGDGDIDYFATNLGETLFGEPHALVRNNGDGTFTEVAAEVGVAGPDFGWGASFADFDRDGDLDLFVNGNVPPLLGPLGNPGRLYVNDGGRFALEPRAGFDLQERYTSGCAIADYDGDGGVDLAVFTETVVYGEDGTPLVPEKPILLRNRFGGSNGWLTVRPVGTVSNAQGIGARITVHDRGVSRVQEVYAGSSFASSESPWPTFGVRGPRVKVEIRWPSGLTECFPAVATRRAVDLVEGTGAPQTACSARPGFATR